MKRLFLFFSIVALLLPNLVTAQSGRTTNNTSRNLLLNVIAQDNSETKDLVKKDNLALFDGGIQQEIEYLRADPTPARITLLLDVSQTLRAETSQLQKLVEILVEQPASDQIMLVSYSEDAEILVDFTTNTNKLQAAVTMLPRKGYPRLYNALTAVVQDAFRKQLGASKRVIILISDGYDSGSKIKYEEALNTLLDENIVVYAFQVPDRTFGAIRPREAGPKPADALRSLTESTGGLLIKTSSGEEILQGLALFFEKFDKNGMCFLIRLKELIALTLVEY
jgi:VWFA-related protein